MTSMLDCASLHVVQLQCCCIPVGPVLQHLAQLHLVMACCIDLLCCVRYVAKQYAQSSVLGSYLDPLADKVLIGSVVGALGYQVG